MEFIDYYQVLGVPKNASKKDIENAYRKQVRQHHPDVSKDTQAEERIKKINEAKEVLSDPDKRRAYDRYGAAWKQAEQQGQAPPGFDGFRQDPRARPGWSTPEEFHFEGGGFSDFFEQLFGGGGFGTRSGRSAGPRPGANQEVRMTLTLEEAAHGGKRRISLRDPRTGRVRTYDVTIPRGIRHGQRIRLTGQGDPGPGGGPSGDLDLEVEIQPHPRFRLEGSDLHMRLPVTPWVAALGGTTRLHTLDGILKVKIPPGSSSGRRIRMTGRGFPNGSGRSGDLFCEIRIVVPERLSKEEEELFRKLQEVSSFAPEPEQANPGPVHEGGG